MSLCLSHITTCSGAVHTQQPERCCAWHPAGSSPSACPTHLVTPSYSSSRKPCGLSKPHHTTTQPPPGNLGQALSLLIKKGIFLSSTGGRSMGIRGGRRQIINTAASASRCQRNGRVIGLLFCFVLFVSIALRCFILPLLLLWRMQLSLWWRSGCWSAADLPHTWTSAFSEGEKWAVLTLDKDFAQEIEIHTGPVALPQIPSLIDWVVCKWLLCGLLGLLRSMFST